MTPQQKQMLQEVRYMTKFVPALMVKTIRKWPNDYRKRLSEMKRKGWVIDVGMHKRFKVWEVTKEGRKAFKSIR